MSIPPLKMHSNLNIIFFSFHFQNCMDIDWRRNGIVLFAIKKCWGRTYFVKQLHGQAIMVKHINWSFCCCTEYVCRMIHLKWMRKSCIYMGYLYIIRFKYIMFLFLALYNMENIKYTYTHALTTKCVWAFMNGSHDDNMFHTATTSKRKWIPFSFFFLCFNFQIYPWLITIEVPFTTKDIYWPLQIYTSYICTYIHNI